MVGWLPVLDEDKSKRPTQGYHSSAARNNRLFHACWNNFLGGWPEHSEHARVLVYGDGKARLTRHYVGACLGDMQEFDKWSCEPHSACHRCPAGILEFLRTDLPSAPKTMLRRMEDIIFAASGDSMREQGVLGMLEGAYQAVQGNTIHILHIEHILHFYVLYNIYCIYTI